MLIESRMNVVHHRTTDTDSMNSTQEKKGLIMSVGEAVQPLVNALRESPPDYVCWLASHRSVEVIPEIKETTNLFDGDPIDHKILVENVHQLPHCYRKSVQCSRWMNDHISEENQVTVNYTGGTKSMSAALILASINHGYRFAYTKKNDHSPDGEQDSEPVESTFLSDNPWDILAVREWDQISSYFNAYQFEACRQVIQDAVDHVSPRQTHLLENFSTVVDAYDAWDKFNHRRGRSMFEKGIREIEELLELDSAGCLAPIVPQLRKHRSFLESLEEKTEHFKTLDHALLVDLYHNSKRRIEEGKWSDAAARLYRLVEMRGQLEVNRIFGESTGDFPAEKIPGSLQDEYVRKYRSDRDDCIKLPLEPTYRLLKEHGNELGNTFVEIRAGFHKVQRARNRSILAHGTQPVREDHVDELLNVTDRLVNVEKDVQFPEIPRFECV